MWVLVIAAVILCLILGISLSNMFDFYSVKDARGGKNADDMSRELLRSRGVYDVIVVQIGGDFTDNFNPKTKTLSLSERVYGHGSISALAVAAHETGHALQYAEEYAFAAVRDYMVPAVSFASKSFGFILSVGIIFGFAQLYTLGAYIFGAVLLFQLITLPVEFNASARAIELLRTSHVLTADELEGARKVLFAASLTYVGSALSLLTQFLRFWPKRRL